MRRAFSISVWYLLRSMKMVKDIDVLCDVIFVICMSNKYGYLVRDEFVIYVGNMYV